MFYMAWDVDIGTTNHRSDPSKLCMVFGTVNNNSMPRDVCCWSVIERPTKVVEIGGEVGRVLNHGGHNDPGHPELAGPAGIMVVRLVGRSRGLGCRVRPIKQIWSK
jgi:hypothetical protein